MKIIFVIRHLSFIIRHLSFVILLDAIRYSDEPRSGRIRYMGSRPHAPNISDGDRQSLIWEYPCPKGVYGEGPMPLSLFLYFQRSIFIFQYVNQY